MDAEESVQREGEYFSDALSAALAIGGEHGVLPTNHEAFHILARETQARETEGVSSSRPDSRAQHTERMPAYATSFVQDTRALEFCPSDQALEAMVHNREERIPLPGSGTCRKRQRDRPTEGELASEPDGRNSVGYIRNTDVHDDEEFLRIVAESAKVTDRMPIADYTAMDTLFLHNLMVEEEEARRKEHVYAADMQVMDPALDKASVKGDFVVEEIFTVLDSMGLRRSEQQREFHREFVKACLPKIYGESFETERERILEKFNLKQIEYEVLIMTPRQFGKTTAVAMFMAALAWAAPNIIVSVFSTAGRASTALLTKAHAFLLALPNARSRVVRKNDEFLQFSGPDGKHGGDIRTLYSFPSNVNVRCMRCEGASGFSALRTKKRKGARGQPSGN